VAHARRLVATSVVWLTYKLGLSTKELRRRRGSPTSARPRASQSFARHRILSAESHRCCDSAHPRSRRAPASKCRRSDACGSSCTSPLRQLPDVGSLVRIHAEELRSIRPRGPVARSTGYARLAGSTALKLRQACANCEQPVSDALEVIASLRQITSGSRRAEG
jgi:hypothetical protein